MPSCVVKTCKNNSLIHKKPCGITFHKFPRDSNWKQKWIEVIRLSRNEETWLPSRFSVVCSTHFADNDLYVTKCGLRRVMKNAIPKKDTIDQPDNDNINNGVSENLDLSVPISSHAESQNQTCDRYFDVKASTSIYTSPSDETVNNKNSNTTIFEENLCSPVSGVKDSDIESIFDTPRKSKLKKQLRKQIKMVVSNKKKIKLLNQKVRRLKKSNKTLKNIIKELKEKNYVDSDVYNKLTENVVAADIFNSINCKQKSNKKLKYTVAIKKFCLTLNYYSPKAYDFVRSTFETCLPHPKTLSKWYSHINGEPGFSEEAFAAIKQKTQASEHRLLCALIFDEMAIRQQKIWDGKKYQGLVDMGTGTTDSDALASQAFVFLLVAVNQRWKIPLGYFLCNSISGDQKANLIKMCLIKCFEADVDVISLTFDGHSTNFTAMEILGCNLRDIKSIKSTFKHPSCDKEVACILDPSHVIKLLRNQLESKREFLDIREELVQWNYLVQLNELQSNEGLHLANKLTTRHIAFKNQIMKVKLATQLLSRSIATALRICREDLKLPIFEKSKPTENFVNMANNYFDIFNTRGMNQFGFKKPLFQGNKDQIYRFLDEMKKYITELKLKTQTKRQVMKDGRKTFVITRYYKRIVEAKCKSGFLGVLINIESLKYLYDNIVENEHQLAFLPTYKFSQDHIEILFGSIRMHGGHNDNPNVKQFKSIYKKLLTHLELKCLGSGNCIPLENIAILNCSSAIQVINTTTGSYRHDEDSEELSAFDFFEPLQPDIEEMVRRLDVPDLNNLRQYIVGYIAGAVVHYLSKRLKCEACLSRLLSTERYDFHKLITLRNKGGLNFPSKDIFAICCACEIIIRKIIKENIIIKSERQHLFVVSQILKTFIGKENIFFDLENEHNFSGLDHKINLIRTVVEKYLNIRFHHISKLDTISRSRDTKRQYYRKLTQHKGC